jgi:hypothetical protein
VLNSHSNGVGKAVHDIVMRPEADAVLAEDREGAQKVASGPAETTKALYDEWNEDPANMLCQEPVLVCFPDLGHVHRVILLMKTGVAERVDNGHVHDVFGGAQIDEDVRTKPTTRKEIPWLREGHSVGHVLVLAEEITHLVVPHDHVSSGGAHAAEPVPCIHM